MGQDAQEKYIIEVRDDVFIKSVADNKAIDKVEVTTEKSEALKFETLNDLLNWVKENYKTHIFTIVKIDENNKKVW